MRTSGPGGRLYLMAVAAAGAALLGTTAAAVSLLLIGSIGIVSCTVIPPIVALAVLVYRAYKRNASATLRRLDDLMQVHLSTIEALAMAIDAKDPHAQGRTRRVQAYAMELARLMKVPRLEFEAVRAAALLHDIGKLAIPDHLLHKPGKLTDMEFQKVKAHPAVAADILAHVNFPYPVVPAVRHHHERWDGSGYPDGLKGEAIPLAARVLAVADAFEALTSDRAYRGRKSPEEACALIEAWSGMQFDPAVVTTLRRNLGRLIVSPYRASQGATGPAVPGDAASGPLEAADILGLWSGVPAGSQSDPGGFGESLHRGIGAERIDDVYAGPAGAVPAGPGGDREGPSSPGIPGPLDALQQGVAQSNIWLERDESGAIVGRQTAVLSTISSAHREVYSLYEIAQSLGSSLRLPEVLDLVAGKIGQLVPFRSCVIYLLEDHSDSLSARFVSGANVENLRGRALRVGEGITGWAALQKSNRFSQSVDLDLAGAGLDLSEYSTAAAFPLIHDGQVLGVITLYFPKGVTCLDDHIRMMDIIVRLAAAAVRNGTLFAETQESALTDGLTNLPNSRYLRQVFEQEKVRSQQAGQPMAFLEADLDNFKVINDRFGHHVGDRYLSEISRVLKSHLRERDILVRLSGDEFAALLPMTGFAQAALLAERLQQAVDLFRLRLEEGNVARSGLSIGIALFPQDGEGFEDLLVRADHNMYQNKAARKNARLEMNPNVLPFPIRRPSGT
ncbi:MAG TPA: HD domain-containing phosphohydrolase [Candidatus Polarisedimenticolia bacterium]|nr:HD domain-containing phosphohydrolase [Candidatus Polarisedimenticolia bacterium]